MTGYMPTVLAVDDTPENLALIRGLLKGKCRVLVAINGEEALRLAWGEEVIDLVLLDVMMPEMDGYEVCRRLKAEPCSSHLPVIFLTALADAEDEARGLALGAIDYVTKPINPPVLVARVITHLQAKQARDLIENRSRKLDALVAERTMALAETRDAMIFALAALAETRDNETGNHIRRTQYYIRTLAEGLSRHPDYSVVLDPEAIDLLFKSAPLHDIGKVGVPDGVLLKPGKLDAEEWSVMRRHTILGRDAILSAEKQLSSGSSYLRFASEIAYSHHEKWDGSGYPEGLTGTAIPLSARLMAVADVYDALISRRAYKPPLPHEEAVRIITAGAGAHFDPAVVEVFLSSTEDFRCIADRFRDAGDH